MAMSRQSSSQELKLTCLTKGVDVATQQVQADQSQWLRDAIEAQIEYQKMHPTYTTQRAGEAPMEHTLPETSRVKVVNAPYVGMLGSKASLAQCFRSTFKGISFEDALDAAHSAGLVTFLGAKKNPWRSLSTPKYANATNGEPTVTVPSELAAKMASWGR